MSFCLESATDTEIAVFLKTVLYGYVYVVDMVILAMGRAAHVNKMMEEEKLDFLAVQTDLRLSSNDYSEVDDD